MPARPFGAAVFDMDGLLLDSEWPILHAWLEAAREHGVPIEPQTYLQVVGRRAADGRASFRAALGQDFPFDAVRTRVQALLVEARRRDGHVLKPGARALLARLQRQGIPCAVASSTRRAEVEARLGSTGLLGHFAALAAGDEVAEGKPSPDVYLLAADRLGVAACTCIAFEDSEHGAQAALAAGMAVVVVPDLLTPGPELRSASLAVLDSLVDTHTHHRDWFGSH